MNIISALVKFPIKIENSVNLKAILVLFIYVLWLIELSRYTFKFICSRETRDLSPSHGDVRSVLKHSILTRLYIGQFI